LQPVLSHLKSPRILFKTRLRVVLPPTHKRPKRPLPEFSAEILWAFISPGSLFHDRNDFPTQIIRKTALKIDAERPTETSVGIYRSAVCQNTVLKNFKSHNGNVDHKCEITWSFGWEAQ
jgi:hypothetical protein